MKVIISGIEGQMGRKLYSLCKENYCGAVAVGGVDVLGNGGQGIDVPVVNNFGDAVWDADCIIDFSHRSQTGALLRYAVSRNIPLVLATTGQTDEEKAEIKKASEKIPIFFAANYSLGIALLTSLAVSAAAVFPDGEIEIIEKHHDRKVDAPSGTALMLADAIKDEVHPDWETVCGRNGFGKRTKKEIGIHSLRMGNVVGEHEVIISAGSQTISLKHEAHDRALFAEGALSAAAFLMGKPAGLYDMNSMITEK